MSVAPMAGMAIAPAPDIQPAHTAPHLSPVQQEEAARHVLNRWLGLRVAVSAPTWRQILFGGRPDRIEVTSIPDACLGEIDKTPQVMPGDGPAAEALKLLSALRDARPRGGSPRSISARRQLPPSRDAMATWARRVFLIAAGPVALRLLAAAGNLLSNDVALMDAAYPAGLDAERMASVEAATAFTAAALRNAHHEADLPSWLNDQMLTLMAETSPADFYQALYDGSGSASKTAPGPSFGGTKSVIADQAAPNPTPGR